MAHGSDAELLNADQPAKRVRLPMYRFAALWLKFVSAMGGPASRPPVR